MGMGIHFIFFAFSGRIEEWEKIEKKSLRSICNIVILYAYAKMAEERKGI